MTHEEAYQAWVKARKKLDEAKGIRATKAALKEENKARCAFIMEALRK